MKANEMRIGNLVYICDDDAEIPKTLHRVNATDFNGMVDFMEGIQLTEDLLRISGFFQKEELHGDYFYRGNLYQSSKDDEFVIAWNSEYHYIRDISSSSYDGSTEYRTTKMQYVHQFQNIFFALTGTELEFSLPKNR